MYLTGLWSHPVSPSLAALCRLQFVPEEQQCLSVLDVAASHVSSPGSPGSRRTDWEMGVFLTCITAGEEPWGSCAQTGKSFPLLSPTSGLCSSPRPPAPPPQAGTQQVTLMKFDSLRGFRMQSPPPVTLDRSLCLAALLLEGVS